MSYLELVKTPQKVKERGGRFEIRGTFGCCCQVPHNGPCHVHEFLLLLGSGVVGHKKGLFGRTALVRSWGAWKRSPEWCYDSWSWWRCPPSPPYDGCRYRKSRNQRTNKGGTLRVVRPPTSPRQGWKEGPLPVSGYEKLRDRERESL